MSNNSYEINFEGVKLEYVKTAGTGAPLFVVGVLAKAFGVQAKSGYWYSPRMKQYISKRSVNGLVRRVITLAGVLSVIRQRKPLWEQDFRDVFFADTTQDTQQGTQMVIQPDNLYSAPDWDVTKLVERQDKMDIKLDRLLELVNIPTAASIRTPKLIPIYGTGELVRVPSRAEHLFMNMSRATNDHGTDRRVLKGEPIYSHVEGYRTYKEMLAAVGLDIFINTQKGRDLSRRMAKLAQKYGVKYYLVVDTVRYHQQRGEEKRKFHMGTYCINAYPEELWAVVEPVAQQYLDK